MLTSQIFTAAHQAAKVADQLVAYKVRFVAALKAAWKQAKQTVKTVMNTTTNITDLKVTVAENENYKLYLKGCYNAAGFGDSQVRVKCKKAITAWGKGSIGMSKFGWKETARFLVLSGQVAPELNKLEIEAFVTQQAAAIEAAQTQFIANFRSDSDKAYAHGMTNLMNDNTEAIEDGLAK